MTVKQLIKKLEGLEQDRVVVLACDSEGNRHSPLAGVAGVMYRKEGSWSGEVFDEDDSDHDRAIGDKRAVVLWPVA